MGIHIRSVSPSAINMLRLVIVAVLVACAYASLVPFGYSGLAGYHGYSPFGYSGYARPLAYAAGYNAPVAYASHAAFPPTSVSARALISPTSPSSSTDTSSSTRPSPTSHHYCRHESSESSIYSHVSA